MRWSWRIARIAGIDVFVHFTFLFLLIYVGAMHYAARNSITDAIGGLIFILALFCIVVMHELGHALAARRYGIRTRDITLLPIGGMARLERMPDDPRQELIVALAGPAVNVVLAGAIFAGLVLGQGLAPIGEILTVEGNILNQLFWINVLLVAFNLLPAFPMDGGRVLRALLAMKFNYVRATQVAASIGQGMALLFGFGGLMMQNPLLIFIALFVWLGAAQEASMAQMRAAMDGIPVMNAMITDFRALRSQDSLVVAIEHIIAGFQQDFPVVDDEVLVGVLTRHDLTVAIQQRGPSTLVGEVMKRDFVTAESRDMLQTALTRLQNGGCRTLPVVDQGRLVGLLTTENLAEVLMIQEALQAARERQRPIPGEPVGTGAPQPSRAYPWMARRVPQR